MVSIISSLAATQIRLHVIVFKVFKMMKFDNKTTNSMTMPLLLLFLSFSFGSDCPDEIKDGRSVSDVCSEEKEERFPGIDLESGFGSICR